MTWLWRVSSARWPLSWPLPPGADPRPEPQRGRDQPSPPCHSRGHPGRASGRRAGRSGAGGLHLVSLQRGFPDLRGREPAGRSGGGLSPRLLIGVVAFYVFRLLRRRPTLAAAVAAVAGTLTNTFGVLGILIVLGTLPVALLAPIFTMNVPIEIALAILVAVPTVAALRARGRGRIAALRK